MTASLLATGIALLASCSSADADKPTVGQWAADICGAAEAFSLEARGSTSRLGPEPRDVAEIKTHIITLVTYHRRPAEEMIETLAKLEPASGAHGYQTALSEGLERSLPIFERTEERASVADTERELQAVYADMFTRLRNAASDTEREEYFALSGPIRAALTSIDACGTLNDW